MSLDFCSEIPITYKPYTLQNATLKRALEYLSNLENGSWIFRFDYTNNMYFLTIKNGDEYINHHVYLYCKNTDTVIIKTGVRTSETFSTLEDYILEMQKIYYLNLSKQIFI
jgi:hypothetical protein